MITEVSPLPAGWIESGRPLEIDVGCHKGLFLAEMAALYPDRNFLGIERQAERVERTNRKVQRLEMRNAAVICGEGHETLRALPSDVADHIHVLFPDPWPKRRHHIRRLIQPSFIETCLRLLKPGGILRLVTDDEPYARDIRIHAAAISGLVPCEDDREYPLTEFQKKFLVDGRPVFALILRKLING